MKRALPIASGGLHPRLVPKIIGDLGYDAVMSAGGAIHGHPMGATAGAKAMRQAIDAVMAGIDLEKYADDHKELEVALEKWK